jgi:hypothetical protein
VWGNLVQYVHAIHVWFGLFQELGIITDHPIVASTFRDWWSRTRIRFRKQVRKEFEIVVIVISWNLWKKS